MDPVGILKAWTAKVRMKRARMTATTIDSRYSRGTDFLKDEGDAGSFSAILLAIVAERRPRHRRAGLRARVTLPLQSIGRPCARGVGRTNETWLKACKGYGVPPVRRSSRKSPA